MKAELAVKTLVIMGVVALVLVVLVAFFVPAAFQQTTVANAQQVFARKCIEYRAAIPEDNYLNAYRARDDTEFIEACETLSYGSREYPNRCLEKCPADMEITKEEFDNNRAALTQSLLEA